MRKNEIRVYADLEALSRAAAAEIVNVAGAAIAKTGRFAVALAGGSTPRQIYSIWAESYRDRIDWTKIHFFWGDERCVPPTDADSNFAMAWHALISKVPVPSQNVHRMPVDGATPERAAQAYEKELRAFFSLSVDPAWPLFDLILLGLGADGHTASLFPNTTILEEPIRWVAPVMAPEGYRTRPRLTLTLPLINKAKEIFFLVAGAEKQKTVSSILNQSETAHQLYPAARVQPDGRTVWFLDQAAGNDAH